MKRITVYADFDWRKTATELQIPIKLLESYSIRWDEL